MKHSDAILMGTTTMKKKFISNQTFTKRALLWDFQEREVNKIIFFPKSKPTPAPLKKKKKIKKLLLSDYILVETYLR